MVEGVGYWLCDGGNMLGRRWEGEEGMGLGISGDGSGMVEVGGIDGGELGIRMVGNEGKMV